MIFIHAYFMPSPDALRKCANISQTCGIARTMTHCVCNWAVISFRACRTFSTLPEKYGGIVVGERGARQKPSNQPNNKSNSLMIITFNKCLPVIINVRLWSLAELISIATPHFLMISVQTYATELPRNGKIEQNFFVVEKSTQMFWFGILTEIRKKMIEHYKAL